MKLLHDLSLAALIGLGLSIAGCAASPKQPTGGDGGSTAGGGGATGGGGSVTGGGGTGGSTCTTEVCDGVDNNCDGVVDEGCECLAGDTEECYSGPEGTKGVGACKAGTRACDPATFTFGPCMGETLPADKETCNAIDDDCNGSVDDLPDMMCGVGACAVMAPACVNGQPGTCVPNPPTVEMCDGLDNDCDQLVDETFPDDGKACDTGKQGICQAGIWHCTAGAPTCDANQMAGGELCDGLGNDCDGTVDNNIPGTGGNCSTGALGVCAAGIISCQGGVVDCFSITPSSPEKCDNLDNNCDGKTDENNPEGGGACQTGQLGACATGHQQCTNGALVCKPDALAQPETCDGMDNNCDGQIDEGNPGAGGACSCGGTKVCQSGSLFCTGCTKEVDCNNGLDDDNDGAIDCADSQCALGCNANVQPCPAGQKLLVLSSGDVPKAIVDSSTITSVMSFSEAGTVQRVVMQLNINHTWDADLDIVLQAPDGTFTDVTSDNGSSSDNYTDTIFNDTCPSVVNGSAPFNGCYAPEQANSTFTGKPLAGQWTLKVTDDAGGDTGTLNSWSLAICYQ